MRHNQTRKPQHERFELFKTFQRIPLEWFRNDSTSWGKLQEFLDAYVRRDDDLTDYNLNFDFNGGVYLAGGSLVRAFLGLEEFSDFDVWAPGISWSDAIVSVETLAGREGLIRITNEKGRGYAPTYVTKAMDIQVCEMPEDFTVVDTLDSFDFYVNQIATDGKEVLIHPKALDALTHKQLEFNYGYRPDRGANALQSTIEARVAKYMKMGFARPTRHGPGFMSGYGVMIEYWPWKIGIVERDEDPCAQDGT